MNTLFIKYGNQIFKLEAIASVEYSKLAEKDEPLPTIFSFRSRLNIGLVSGETLHFFNDAADIIWKVVCDKSVDLEKLHGVNKV